MAKQRRLGSKAEHPKSKQRTTDYFGTSDQAKRSTAAKARLAAAMASTKLYQAYKQHLLAPRVMTFRDFRNARKREQILKAFASQRPILSTNQRRSKA